MTQNEFDFGRSKHARRQLVFDRRQLLAGLASATIAGAATAKPTSGYPAVRQLLDGYVSAKKLSGAVYAIGAPNAKPTFVSVGSIGFGGNDPAMRPDSIFRIYSMSKPVTGLAIMRLIQDGKLKLDQPLSDIYPEFREQRVLVNAETMETRPATSQITIRHLLTHTSGLVNAINNNALAKIYIKQGIKPGRFPGMEEAPGLPRVHTLDELMSRLATMPLDFDPGTKWEYSIGPDVLGAVVQRVSGVSYYAYLKKTFFGPLGMPDTDFMAPTSKVGRLTDLPLVKDGKLTPFDTRVGSSYENQRDIESGSGGLVSTAQDYIKFASMWLNEGELGHTRIISAETAKLARSNLLPAGVSYAGGNGYGAGVSVIQAPGAMAGQEPVSSYGWSGAAGTQCWMDPVNKVSVVLMVQFMPSNAYPLTKEIRQATYKDLPGAQGH